MIPLFSVALLTFFEFFYNYPLVFCLLEFIHLDLSLAICIGFSIPGFSNLRLLQSYCFSKRLSHSSPLMCSQAFSNLLSLHLPIKLYNLLTFFASLHSYNLLLFPLRVLLYQQVLCLMIIENFFKIFHSTSVLTFFLN